MIETPKFELDDPRLWYYRAKIIRVIDGDTIIGFLDAGFNRYEIVKLRLSGVDAPELRPREGSQEQRTAEKLLAAKAAVRLRELVDGKEVIIRTFKAGKWGRWLATVYIDGHERSANEILLEEDLAVKYGDPRPWRNESKKIN